MKWLLPVGLVLALVVAGFFLARRLGRGPGGFDPALASAAVAEYAGHLHGLYGESHGRADALRASVRAFLAAPDAKGLEACKAAWTSARAPYLQAEIARFSSGPIDRSPDGPEKFLNAWPLDESYIDSIIDDAARFPSIDEPALRKANENGGEANISTGWHAVEFLLWGRDVSPGPGGGMRPSTDFVDGAPHAGRRRAYLGLCADLLVKDLAFVRDQWAPGSASNYRAEFLALPPRAALSRILTGIGTLAIGELRGERLTVPYTLKDKEEEHSCFSDTTHLDHLNDALGIRNAWNRGLRALGAKADPRIAADVDAAVEAVVRALEHPSLNPFDQAILGDDARPGRAAIREALSALARFNDAFTRLAARMDVPVNTRLP